MGSKADKRQRALSHEDCMTFVTSMTVVFIATLIGTWINDHTKLGGDYMSDEELHGKA